MIFSSNMPLPNNSVDHKVVLAVPHYETGRANPFQTNSVDHALLYAVPHHERSAIGLTLRQLGMGHSTWKPHDEFAIYSQLRQSIEGAHGDMVRMGMTISSTTLDLKQPNHPLSASAIFGSLLFEDCTCLDTRSFSLENPNILPA